MSIVSSTYEADSVPAVAGRYWVKERHTDSTGVVHTANYLAPDGFSAQDMQSKIEARAIEIGLRLAENEVEELMNG